MRYIDIIFHKEIHTWLSMSLPLSALFVLLTFISGRMNLYAKNKSTKDLMHSHDW